MATERTLSIIKPDATRRNLTGAINDRFEKSGLRIVAQKRLQLSRAQAESFYGVHRERPFFASLVEFMTSGPVVVQVLEGQDAVAKNRDVMGATNPDQRRRRHDPQGLRREHRGQLGPRLGQCRRTRRSRSRSSSLGSRSSADSTARALRAIGMNDGGARMASVMAGLRAAALAGLAVGLWSGPVHAPRS